MKAKKVPVFKPDAGPVVDLRNLTFRRLDVNGTELAAGVTEGHTMTHYPQLGLIFDVRPWKNVSSRKAAHAAAKNCDLLGRKGQWVIAEDVEVAALINRRFSEPAVDPKAAPNAPKHGWIYTTTKPAWSSVLVWFVGLYDGVVDWYDDSYVGLVVPVLRVPPSQ